jgi:hypothetical protein
VTKIKQTLTTTHAHHPHRNAHINTCASKNIHYTRVFMRKHETDTKTKTYLRSRTHSHTTHIRKQVSPCPAQHAVLGSTSLFAAVLRVAHVPSTATRLMRARVSATAHATQATQVKMNIRNTYSEQHMHNVVTTPEYKYTHKSTQHTTPQLRPHTCLHTGVDGGTCSACSAGKYKSVNGSAECSMCPLDSNSSAASTNLNDCKCSPGYTGEDEYL